MSTRPPPPSTTPTYAPAAAPGTTAETAVSVSLLAGTVKEVIEGSFPPLWVRGEVTEFKAHRNGHWYFTLKDAAAQVRCVVWARDTRRVPAAPDPGMEVVVCGQLNVYAARTEVQLTVSRLMAADGEGLREKALREARATLDREGLLDPARKRRLPRVPRRVAVITSPDGAALHDIVAVARRRNPTVELVVVPAAVQGETAVPSLLAALAQVARWHAAGGAVDTVIIGRGGGSRDDLWAFNDLALARAVAACPVPIISAVGHETDVSLADLVADLRAATPSVAAETAIPALDDLRGAVQTLARALAQGLERGARRARERAERVREALGVAARRIVERRRGTVERLAGTLSALSPLHILARGYAVPQAADGRALRRAAEYAPGDAFTLVVQDGRVDATVRAVRPAPPPGRAP